MQKALKITREGLQKTMRQIPREGLQKSIGKIATGNCRKHWLVTEEGLQKPMSKLQGRDYRKHFCNSIFAIPISAFKFQFYFINLKFSF